jgi:hypothetical protein
MDFYVKLNTLRGISLNLTGQRFLMTFTSTGPLMKSLPMLILSGAVQRVMEQQEPVIPAGDVSLRFGPGQSPFFILMCLAQLQNPHMQGCRGFVILGRHWRIKSISGPLTDGKFLKTGRLFLRFTRQCGARAIRKRGEPLINMMHLLLPHG